MKEKILMLVSLLVIIGSVNAMEIFTEELTMDSGYMSYEYTAGVASLFAIINPGDVNAGETIDTWYSWQGENCQYTGERVDWVMEDSLGNTKRSGTYEIAPRSCGSAIYVKQTFVVPEFEIGSYRMCGILRDNIGHDVTSWDCGQFTIGGAVPDTCEPHTEPFGECQPDGKQCRRYRTANCAENVECQPCDRPTGLCEYGEHICEGNVYFTCTENKGNIEWVGFGPQVGKCEVECIVASDCDDALFCNNNELLCTNDPTHVKDNVCTLAKKYCANPTSGIGECVSIFKSCDSAFPDETDETPLECSWWEIGKEQSKYGWHGSFLSLIVCGALDKYTHEEVCEPNYIIFLGMFVTAIMIVGLILAYFLIRRFM